MRASEMLALVYCVDCQKILAQKVVQILPCQVLICLCQDQWKLSKQQRHYVIVLFTATLPPSVPDSHVSWLPDWWPKWLDLNVLVPVIATIVVIIVGIVVVCVAVTRRKNGIENLRLRGETKAIMQVHLQGPCPPIPLPRILLPPL